MPHILVIDDEPQVASVIQQMLEREGYSVATASNGADAVRAFRTTPADLVITDILMPDQDGLETIAQIRRVRPAVPIIAVSGGGFTHREVLLRMAEPLGARRTFEKPFDPTELVDAVKALLE